MNIVEKYVIPIQLLGQTFQGHFYIVKDLASQIICGMDFIEEFGISINGKTRRISIPKETLKVEGQVKENNEEINPGLILSLTCTREAVIDPFSVILELTTPEEVENNKQYMFIAEETDEDFRIVDTLIDPRHKDIQILALNRTAGPVVIRRGTEIGQLMELVETLEDPTPVKETTNTPDKNWTNKLQIAALAAWKDKYLTLMRHFPDIFSQSEFDLGWTDSVEHKIVLKHRDPIFTKQFRIPLAHQKIINEFVDDMLDKNLIEATRSNYNSHICVQKKNGKWRPVVDLRRINAATVVDAYSIKDVRTCLDTIGSHQSSVFSSIDLVRILATKS